jgi:serine protease DegQ
MTSAFRLALAAACVFLATDAACAETLSPTPSLAPMLERVVPGVVSIGIHGTVGGQANPLFSDPFFRRFFGSPGREFQAAGSGVVVDGNRGYILTNNHVVANSEEITVNLNDGRHLPAKKIGADPTTDIAVVQVAADQLTGVRLGNSDALKVGDYVVAVGNPFGLGQTVTFGIVSALGRTGLGIEGYEDFIQTDASINPGNSGGALVNLNGEVVGINTAIIGPSGGNVGIGLAIPTNLARDVMEQLIAHGEIKRGQLGIMIQKLTPDLARALRISVVTGALVTEVVAGSPAEKAGITAGDVITKVNGQPISTASDLRNKTGLMPIGTELHITLIRKGASQEVTAELAEANAKR